jgi:hypothetical protein
MIIPYLHFGPKIHPPLRLPRIVSAFAATAGFEACLPLAEEAKTPSAPVLAVLVSGNRRVSA